MFPPRYPPISNLYLLHFFSVYFHSEFIFLSTSRTEWKKKWWVRTGCESIDQHHAYAYRLSFPFLVFRHLSLSPSLSLSPPPSPQETSTSPFSFRPVETDYVFNGVPLVWWEISFKPVVVSLVACLLCQSFKIRRIRGKFVLSKGCCTNFYLSANWKINFDGSSFFQIE